MSKYSTLNDIWVGKDQPNSKEKYLFISYAVRGPMTDIEHGLRDGLPIDYPIPDSPVSEPSPLNNRWEYNPPGVDISGIL